MGPVMLARTARQRIGEEIRGKIDLIISSLSDQVDMILFWSG